MPNKMLDKDPLKCVKIYIYIYIQRLCYLKTQQFKQGQSQDIKETG